MLTTMKMVQKGIFLNYCSIYKFLIFSGRSILKLNYCNIYKFLISSGRPILKLFAKYLQLLQDQYSDIFYLHIQFRDCQFKQIFSHQILFYAHKTMNDQTLKYSKRNDSYLRLADKMDHLLLQVLTIQILKRCKP